MSEAIAFEATLQKPGGKDQGAKWLFLNVPQAASDKFPARGMVAAKGEMNGADLFVNFEPDGAGGHWLRVDEKLQKSAKVSAGDTVTVAVTPSKEAPEPEVPDDLAGALKGSTEKARETWKAITAAARRDWIFWITSGKKEETQVKRVGVAISKMEAGSRRPCCFDNSGMYSKSLSCPIAEDA